MKIKALYPSIVTKNASVIIEKMGKYGLHVIHKRIDSVGEGYTECVLVKR